MAARTPARKILVIGVFALIWWVFFWPAPHSGGFHQITSAPLPPLDFLKATSDRRRKHAEYYASKAAREFCAAHGHSVFTPRSVSKERKVYDLVMVNSELDFLEIRLNTLYDHVDYFIIVESPKTFQGEKKPLVIKEN